MQLAKKLGNKGFSRMTWVIFFMVYLFLLGVFLGAIGVTYGSETEFYTSAEQSVGTSIILNIATGISIIPVWLNILFVVLPVGFLIYIIFTQNTPLANAGT